MIYEQMIKDATEASKKQPLPKTSKSVMRDLSDLDQKDLMRLKIINLSFTGVVKINLRKIT